MRKRRGVKHLAGNLLQSWGAPRDVVQGNCKVVRSPESLEALNLQMSLPFMAVILEDCRPTPKVLLKHF